MDDQPLFLLNSDSYEDSLNIKQEPDGATDDVHVKVCKSFLWQNCIQFKNLFEQCGITF